MESLRSRAAFASPGADVSAYRFVRTTYRLIPARARRALRASPLGALVTVLRNRLPPSHDDEYDAHYYEMVDRTASESSAVIGTSIVRELAPTRVVDVGCGTGALLAALREYGVECAGLEYSRVGLAYCRRRSLSVARFDLEW